MMKRYTLNLGAGLITLMAMGVGCGHAVAQAQPAASAGNGVTGTQLLAMAQAADGVLVPLQIPVPETPASAPTPPYADGKPKEKTKDLRTETTPGSDGLKQGVAYIEADQVTTDKDNNVTATGDVQLRQNGRTILADKVISDSTTGVTKAEGHTQTINEDGSIQFADTITYDDNMQSGYSENFASIGKDNIKVFARRLEQVNPNINRLTNVIYTPCELCRKNGETSTPTWSIEASKITQRKDKKMVFYDNAIVKLKGVPVLYSPFLWTPDPELDRASGLLTPKISSDKKRGFSYEQPYLWSISPYQYLIISPQFNSNVNPLLNLDYERQFYSGLLHIRGGFTNEAFFDNFGDRHGQSATRDYLLADGAFKINKNWRWGFTAQHVKDDFDPGTYPAGAFPSGGSYANFFERYNIDGAFDQVGDLSVDSRQLINQFNLIRQAPNAYFAITLANFQSLQIANYLDYTTSVPLAQRTSLQPYATSSDFFPVIAPQIEAYWSPKSRLLGGQLTVSANAIGIYHKRLSQTLVGLRAIDIGAPEASDGVTGYDTSRVSGEVSWFGDMTTRSGLKWGPFVDLRHDYYKVTDLDTNGLSGEVSRDLATAGLNISYPLFRKFKSFTFILEPTAQMAISPDAQVSPYLPTEDSQSFEFDETTLFAYNKSSGFDIYESGARLNLGLRSQLQFDSGFEIEGLVGRVLRDKDESQILQTVTITKAGYAGTYMYDPSGLGSQNSDWIVTGSFDTSKGFSGYTRLRLDGETSRLSQGEYGLTMRSSKTSATFRYIVNNVLTQAQIKALPIPVVNGKLQRFGDNYRDIQLYGQHFFTSHWGMSARLDRDAVSNTWRKSTVSAIYKDDCIQFELVYQQNDTLLTTRNGKPSSSIFFRLNIPTFGSKGSTFNDVR